MRTLGFGANDIKESAIIFESFTAKLKNNEPYAAILKSLDNLGLRPDSQDMISAASKNHAALIAYLEFERTKEPRLITQETIFKIFITILQNLKGTNIYGANPSAVINVLLSFKPDFTIRDVDGNNCLHILALYNTEEDIKSFLRYFMPIVGVDEFRHLYNEKNNIGQIPKNVKIFKDNPFSEVEETLGTVRTSLLGQAVGPNPNIFFPSALPNPYALHRNTMSEFIRAVNENDSNRLLELISKYGREYLQKPETGFYLLLSTINSGKKMMASILLQNGCDIFLRNDHPLRLCLFTGFPSEEIEQLLLRTEMTVNEARGSKRHLQDSEQTSNKAIAIEKNDDNPPKPH